MKKVIQIILLLTLFLITVSSVNADTNITSTDNLGKTINNANNGDTINLGIGTYKNNVTNITINKNLTIQGKDVKTTIIYAQNLGRVFNVTSGNSLTLINITLTNGYITGSGGAIYSNGKVTINNCVFIGNNATLGGGAIHNAGNLSINNSNFNNNIVINTDGLGGALCNELGKINITNSNFTNNKGTFGGTIYNIFGNISINNSKFNNNIAYNPYSHGGAIYTEYGTININNSDFNNNIATYGGVISVYFANININNSNFNNNTATDGSCIYTGWGSNVNIIRSNFTNNKGGATINIEALNANITECNIHNNSQGITIDEDTTATINYNRIFNNTNNTGFDLDNSGVNTNANLNWWGDNTPLVSGITLGNYFIMNVTNATSLVSNGTVSFNYTFRLNTNDSFDASLLPFFVTNVFTNVTSGAIDTFDARFDRIINSTLSVKNQTVEYTFITDNEIQTLDVFFNATKIKTVIKLNNVQGKNGENVTLIAILTDENGTPLSGKELTFHIAGQTFTAITDPDGIARVQYTINKNDFADGRLLFTVTFDEDETYLSSNSTGIITLIEEPNPPTPTPTPTPNITNKTHNPSVATITKATVMKETGIPIIAILIVLLSSLGLIYRKK